MIRVVVDPGVLVSAIIGAHGSPPDVVMRAATDERIELVVSRQLLGELERVLARPKFRPYIDEKAATEYVARICRHASLFDDPPDPEQATLRDPADAYLVALAPSADVDFLVSGDKDLLHAEIRGVEVRTPRQLADRLATRPSE